MHCGAERCEELPVDPPSSCDIPQKPSIEESTVGSMTSSHDPSRYRRWAQGKSDHDHTLIALYSSHYLFFALVQAWTIIRRCVEYVFRLSWSISCAALALYLAIDRQADSTVLTEEKNIALYTCRKCKSNARDFAEPYHTPRSIPTPVFYPYAESTAAVEYIRCALYPILCGAILTQTIR
jgi:hypothetical protein